MNIKSYETPSGETRYKFRAYLGKTESGKEVKIQRGGFRTMAQAKAEYVRVMADKSPLQEKKDYTFQQVYEKWLALYETRVKKSTLLVAKRLFNLHILPALGSYRIDKISTNQVQDLAIVFADKHANYKKTFNYVPAVFRFAKNMELISRNPCDFIVYPRKRPKTRETDKVKFWDSAELLRFLSIAEKELNAKWNAFFRLLAFSGMRKGEALALHWNDIDFEKKQISVNKSMISTEDSAKEIGETKTESSNRVLDLDDKTIEFLKRWRVQQGRVTSIVFTNERGNYYIHSYPDKKLNAIIKKHHLPRITIHGFRHTHCTLLIEAGASMKEVQARLGHANISTTMDIYAHLSQNKRKETVEKFSEYLAK